MLTPGTFLQDRYEILEQIGAGGMSYVYKAKDAILGRYVAIKVIKSEFAEDTTYLNKFRTEAQAAAGLEHPNIVNVYDVGNDNGESFIIMEYIEGITLKTYIEKKGRLSFKEATSIAIQVSRGIEAAHTKGIIHRDIKPQNIMISAEGKVKVTDFGIARAATGNTVSTEAMGSVHYISPEQARNGYVDQRSDIYSLGIVMFEMLTGRVPFDGENAVSIAIQHLQTDLPDIAAMVPDCPISIELIVGKCTQKSPDKRYQTLGELILDLKKALISPNEAFVITPEAQEATRVISAGEMNQIRQETAPVTAEPEPVKKKEKPAKSGGFGFLLKDDYDEDFDEDEEEEEDDYDDEDEDDEDDALLNPKIEKLITILGIVAGAIIVILIVYLVLSMTGIIGGSKKSDSGDDTEISEDSTQVEMINILGMSISEATTALNEIGLGIKSQGEIETDEYEPGLIASQSIEEGTLVGRNETVYVAISATGTSTTEVPSVVGYTESDAVTALSNAGFQYTRTYSYSSSVAEGNVISQSPVEGSQLAAGETIAIVVSQGAQKSSIPDVTNLTQTDAGTVLGNQGFKVGTITTANSSTVAAGNVISTDPAAGTSASEGTSVNLVVSAGAGTTYYSYKRTISSSDMEATGCKKLEIEIYDSNDNLLIEGTVKANDVINISNIKTASGYWKVTGEMTDPDEDGNTLYENTEKLTFTKQ